MSPSNTWGMCETSPGCWSILWSTWDAQAARRRDWGITEDGRICSHNPVYSDEEVLESIQNIAEMFPTGLLGSLERRALKFIAYLRLTT